MLMITSNRQIDYYDIWSSRGRDRMIVGFITTYAINAYHH